MMTAATVERQLAEMLADEALIRAPEGALATVLGRVEDLPQRRRPLVSLGPNRLQLQGRRRLLLGLVAAVLAIGIAIARLRTVVSEANSRVFRATSPKPALVKRSV